MVGLFLVINIDGRVITVHTPNGLRGQTFIPFKLKMFFENVFLIPKEKEEHVYIIMRLFHNTNLDLAGLKEHRRKSLQIFSIQTTRK